MARCSIRPQPAARSRYALAILRVTLKGLLQHKIRFVLTTFAVVIGVGFVVGTLVLTDSVRAQFDQLFTDINQGIDLQVKGADQFDQGAFGTSPPIPDTLVDQVAALPGVQSVGANAGGIPALVHATDGKPVTPNGGAPPLAVSWQPTPPTRRSTAVDGGPADGRRPGGARRRRGQEGRRRCGRPGRRSDPEGPGQLQGVGHRPASGRATPSPGPRSSPSPCPRPSGSTCPRARCRPSTSPSTRATSLDDGAAGDRGDPAVRGRGRQRQQVVDDSQKGVSGFVDIFGNVLLGFAGVTLFVSAFLISNTFTIVVGQRVRELALLRAIGASAPPDRHVGAG